MSDKVRVKRHVCCLCMHYGDTHIHHVFDGARRSISERENFVVELCPVCHERVHRDAKLADKFKQECEYDYLHSHTPDEWLKLMGKNYLSLDNVPDPRKSHLSFVDMVRAGHPSPLMFEDFA